MLILLSGDYKTGKTVSACTFPKPLLIEDWDGGFTSVQHARDAKGQLVVPDAADITCVSFHTEKVNPLDFTTIMNGQFVPPYTQDAPRLMAQHNSIIAQLAKDGTYEGKKYNTLVIDSATNLFRVWDEMVLNMNKITHLRVQDYGTLESVLFSQFIPSLKAVLATGKLQHIVLTDHIMMEKDEITGMVLEHPVGPSKAMGRLLGLHFDEIWQQRIEGTEYVWRTRRQGLFQAGSRLGLPDPVRPGTYTQLQLELAKRGGTK